MTRANRTPWVVAFKRLLGGLFSMSMVNSKKAAVAQAGYDWAGAVARIRRGGVSSRAGRRSVLLGMLTSTYANTTRRDANGDPRSGSDR